MLENPLVTALLGALVPLIIGSLWVSINRAVRRRVTFHTPESEALKRIEESIKDMHDSITSISKAIGKIDTEVGHIIPAGKIVVKKIRHDLNRLEPGEEINGDLEEAWEEIKCAEEIHRGMRGIAV